MASTSYDLNHTTLQEIFNQSFNKYVQSRKDARTSCIYKSVDIAKCILNSNRELAHAIRVACNIYSYKITVPIYVDDIVDTDTEISVTEYINSIYGVDIRTSSNIGIDLDAEATYLEEQIKFIEKSFKKHKMIIN